MKQPIEPWRPMSMASEIATHDAPAWQERANFIIFADLSSAGMPGRWEQLWARQLGEARDTLRCRSRGGRRSRGRRGRGGSWGGGKGLIARRDWRRRRTRTELRDVNTVGRKSTRRREGRTPTRPTTGTPTQGVAQRRPITSPRLAAHATAPRAPRPRRSGTDEQGSSGVRVLARVRKEEFCAVRFSCRRGLATALWRCA